TKVKSSLGKNSLVVLLSQVFQKLFQRMKITDQNLSCFSSVESSYDTTCFQLIHNSSCSVISQFQLSLKHGSRTLLRRNDNSCRYIELSIFFIRVNSTDCTCRIFRNIFRKLECR